MTNTEFLPITADELTNKNIESVDFVCVTGDCYVDHPSFGIAIISRLLESKGFSVAILAQPDCTGTKDFKMFGKPNLGFLVTSGNIDSMVNNYTVAKKKRDKDLYSEGGEFGKRPDRACIVYSKKIREAYPDSPIILGGLEASLRRFSHYDYWDDKIRRSILLDSQADIIVYGMGERQISEIAEALQSGIPVSEVSFINGTVYKTKDKSRANSAIELPSYDSVKASKTSYAQSYFLQYSNTDHIQALPLIEKYDDWYVISNTPATPPTTEELDKIYALPYTRTYHPKYTKGIPAIEEVKYSIASSRGCFGACSFCALSYHQGRVVRSRSHESIISEAESFTSEKDFKGYIHDVGGPTANFRNPACTKQEKHGVCKNKMCLYPKPCQNLKTDHSEFTSLLQKLRKIPKIKKVFIRSGIRFDYLLNDLNDEFFYELCEHHISGQLKVAPEHVSDTVLKYMGKPSKDVYGKFVKKYTEINKKIGKEQYIVPYLMSSHPGSDLKAAVELAEYLRDMNISPQQVQDFYPTPGTISTCMYYTGLDPGDMTKVFVAKTPREKAMQRALIQYKRPQNYELVQEALIKANRRDLIGYDKKCLIRPKTNKFKPKEESKPAPKKIKKTIRNVHKKKI